MAISVLTLNLWHDAGAYERRRQALRACIERLKPDLIAFQEALVGRDFDQVAELLEGTDFHIEYGAASSWQERDLSFGNAIASRWPILDSDLLVLPDAGDGETRSAISVTVDSPIGPINATSTHLNWRFHHGAIREKQVVALCAWVRLRRPRDGFPPILMGDFNAEPDAAEIRYVSGLQSLQARSVYFVDAWRVAGGPGPGITWSNDNGLAREWLEPDRRIDYIFAGPPRRDGVGRVQSCRVVCDRLEGGVWPSDHFGVYAELCSEPVPGLAYRGG